MNEKQHKEFRRVITRLGGIEKASKITGYSKHMLSSVNNGRKDPSLKMMSEMSKLAKTIIKIDGR